MKFITEEDLRDIYKKQPFTDYDLQPGERLTPGARQFLLDRGINMYDENDPFINSGINKAESNQNVSACADDRRKKKFCSRMKSLQALFLLIFHLALRVLTTNIIGQLFLYLVFLQVHNFHFLILLLILVHLQNIHFCIFLWLFLTY